MRPDPRLLAATALAVLLVALPACSTVQPDAATVNGQGIDRGDFEDELQQYLDNDAYVSVQEQRSASIRGVGDHSVANQFARSILQGEIVYHLVGAEVARRGLEITDNIRTEATTLNEDNFTKQALDAFPQGFRDDRQGETAELLALALDLAGEGDLGDAGLKARFDADPSQYAQRCMSHILAASQADAAALKTQLDNGADFATLAASSSTDESAASNNGVLGCYAASDASLDATFMAAAFAATPGVVTDPVETQFGWHLILVTEEKPGTFDDAKATIRSQVYQAASQALQTWLDTTLKAADVSVDRRYGIWDVATTSVQPPKGTVEPGTTTTASTEDTTGGTGADTSTTTPAG